MVAAGTIYASIKNISPATAAPIVVAFLIQAALFWGSGFPSVRAAVVERLQPARIAGALVAVSLAPYLVYSLPLGLFSPTALAALAALAIPLAYLFVWAPRPEQTLGWQDVLLMTAAVVPNLSGVEVFDFIYPSPGEPVRDVDILGKLMVFSIGAWAFLCLRPLEGTDYRLWPTGRDLRIGGKYALYYLPVGIPLALGIHLVRFDPKPFDGMPYVGAVAGTAIGIFLAVALSEELCFRGALQHLLTQTLGKAWIAQAIAALAYGAAHLTFHGFPNWRHALATAVLGWFCGSAYREARGVPAAAVCHTLVVITWRFLFQ